MSTMANKVTVKLYATLRKCVECGSKGRIDIDVPVGTTVEHLAAQLGIAPGEVWLVFVNTVRAHLVQELQDGDQVDIFPPVAGG